jgi:hypothetical protein
VLGAHAVRLAYDAYLAGCFVLVAIDAKKLQIAFAVLAAERERL